MSTRPRSLRARLAKRLALLALIALFMSSGFFLYSSWQFRDADADEQLASLAARIASTARREDGADLARIEINPTLARELRRIEGFRFVAYDAESGKLVAAQPPDSTHFVPQAPTVGWASAFFYTQSSDPRQTRQRRIQALLTTVTSPAGPLRIVVMRQEPDGGDVAQWMFAVVGEEVLPILVPLLLAIGLIGFVELRRAFMPVQAAAQQANAVDVASSSARLEEKGLPSEIQPLVQAVNRAIGRLQAGFSQQRRFTANAAHELRTPLAVLQARLDGMAETPDTIAIKQDVDRMARLVGQLLTVARLDTVEEARRDSIDLNEVARDTVARMAPLAVDRGVELALDTPRQPVKVVGDQTLLGDCLRNLIENAIRFTPGGKTIDVAVTELGDIEVHDCGPGVPVAEREQVFGRFWRGENRRGKGAGLGLAIVAETMALHRGKVSVGDSPRGGALFRISLPLESPDGAARDDAAREWSSAAAAS